METAARFDEYHSPAGRRRAWRELVLYDHGFLRAAYANFHTVSPGRLYRAAQPGPQNLARLKEHGIRTIINLRGAKPTGYLFLETEACQKLGLNLVNFRVFSREAPSPEILHNARELFQSIQYPALIHCKSGADRAGMMATLFRFFEDRVPLKQAMDQLSWRYGHIKAGKTGVIDAAFNEYLDYAQNIDASDDDLDAFFDWVDTSYDHLETKARFRASWWGTALSDVILRRE